VESPSLEIFQPRLDAVLCSLLWVTLLGQGVGLGDPQRSLPTPHLLGFSLGSTGSTSTLSGGLHHTIGFLGRRLLPPLAWRAAGRGTRWRCPTSDRSPTEWDTEGGRPRSCPGDTRRDAGDNAHASYAQPAQRARPARSVAPSGYGVSPNLMG